MAVSRREFLKASVATSVAAGSLSWFGASEVFGFGFVTYAEAAKQKLLGVDALVGLCTGSIPMVGGHGTAGAFGPVLEDFGIQGATTLCTAAATYGLIAGSMMGGPIGKMLIERHNLLATVVENAQLAALEITDGVDVARIPAMLDSVRASAARTAAVLEHLIRHAVHATDQLPDRGRD